VTWRRAEALTNLEARLRAELPGVTLGDIRDPAGGSESDHNPWVHDAAGVGVVRAVDVMTTNGTVLASNLAAKLGRHPAMKSGAYVIWNRRIISSDRRSEGWRTYTGDNPHTDHVHVSIARDQRNYDSAAAWGSLTSGSGDLGGTAPSAPPVGPGSDPLTASAAHTYGGVSNAGLMSGAPDGDDVRRLALVGVLLLGGVALVAAGLSRTTKPITAPIGNAAGDVAALIPQARAASAVGAASKGLSK